MSKDKFIAAVIGGIIFVVIASSVGISSKGKKAQEADNLKKMNALENSDGNQLPILNYSFEFDGNKMATSVGEAISVCIPTYTEKEDLALELLIQWFDDEYPNASRQQFQNNEGIELTKMTLPEGGEVVFDNFEGVPSSFEYRSEDHILRCRQLDDFECYCEKL